MQTHDLGVHQTGSRSDFQFPDKVDADNSKRRSHCGLTALATILGDKASTAAATLQLTDFSLLTQLAKDKATGLQRERENAGKEALKHSLKPNSLLGADQKGGLSPWR
jgi:hypothetical protein